MHALAAQQKIRGLIKPPETLGTLQSPLQNLTDANMGKMRDASYAIERGDWFGICKWLEDMHTEV